MTLLRTCSCRGRLNLLDYLNFRLASCRRVPKRLRCPSTVSWGLTNDHDVGCSNLRFRLIWYNMARYTRGTSIWRLLVLFPLRGLPQCNNRGWCRRLGHSFCGLLLLPLLHPECYLPLEVDLGLLDPFFDFLIFYLLMLRRIHFRPFTVSFWGTFPKVR
jgi:hypothetical protein